jgi:hypothetical protein
LAPVASNGSSSSNGAVADQTVYLAGRPSLKGFLRFARKNSVHAISESKLADEWQAANRHIRQLEKDEAGWPDNPAIVQLGPEYEPLLIEFLKDPIVRHNFNTVPTEVAMVELDKLIVHQKHIDLTFVRQLQKKLGPAPGIEDIFRLCLPYDHPHPPVKWSRTSRDSFVFMSPSNDLRFLEAMALDADALRNYPPPGATVGVIGLAVGFGSNFMNAVRAENRVVLDNGSHRAYALRDLGFTHAPCIIQHASSRDDVEAVASEDVREQPDLFLKNPRPSVLKDYFDPRLHKVFEVNRRHRQITLRFQVDEVYVPAL